MAPALVQEIATRRIVQLHRAESFLPGSNGTLTPGRRPDGDCHFHLNSRCSLQVAGGERLLPSACRHFPRVILRDARGDLMTLSHYCPTAATLLLDASNVSIVEAGEPLRLNEPIEGLDARDVLPPLLRPGMLMDVESYGSFERRCLDVCASSADADTALAGVGAAIEDLRDWSPGTESLTQRIDRAFGRASGRLTGDVRLSGGFRVARGLVGPHPWIEPPADFERRWTMVRARGGTSLQGVRLRYLAAATFGNWMVYRSEGLRSLLAWLQACDDIFRIQLVREADADGELTRSALIEALRAADYLVVHTIDSLAFGRAIVPCEQLQARP